MQNKKSHSQVFCQNPAWCHTSLTFFYMGRDLLFAKMIANIFSLVFFFAFSSYFPPPHLLRVSSPQSMPHFFTQPNFSLCLQTPQYKAKFVGSLKRGDIVQTFPPRPNKINFTKSVRRSTGECEWSNQQNFGKQIYSYVVKWFILGFWAGT